METREIIFVLPVIATIFFIVLTILNHYPEIYNYTNPINEANISDEYLKATRTVRFIKVLLVIVFTIIVLNTFLTSIHITNQFGLWSFPLIIALFVILTIYSLVKVFGKNKQKQ